MRSREDATIRKDATELKGTYDDNIVLAAAGKTF